MGSVRWAFRCGSWTPGRSDWLFAARCIQREEKDRIGEFVFAKDAKSAMVRLTANFLFGTLFYSTIIRSSKSYFGSNLS